MDLHVVFLHIKSILTEKTHVNFLCGFLTTVLKKLFVNLIFGICKYDKCPGNNAGHLRVNWLSYIN